MWMLNKESVVVECFFCSIKREKGCARDVFAESTDISRIFLCVVNRHKLQPRALSWWDFRRTKCYQNMFEWINLKLSVHKFAIFIKSSLSPSFFFVVGGIQHNDDDENWEQIGASNDVNEFERSFSSEF